MRAALKAGATVARVRNSTVRPLFPGTSKRGSVVGINLVDPTPLAPVSENAVWIDGKREPVAQVQLRAASDQADGEWSASGDVVDLAMSPIAHVEQKLDIPIVRHRLRHVVGRGQDGRGAAMAPPGGHGPRRGGAQ